MATDLRTFIGQLKRRLRQEADIGDLTHSQTAVLLRLEKEGPTTVSKLARAEGVRSQSMGVTVAALEQNGYVTGVPDATDKRQILISLTEKCHQWMAEGRAAREDYLVRALHDRLDAQDLLELERLIPLLKRLVDA
ncbi:MarR family transcriptional regulator [Klebsiella variicola]|nr:MarR family transcriptional regulator [Klebsiella variicola]